MKLVQLYLKAFGPFTDREPLDFHSTTPGLHIIYGPNEAGKSSSLRALKALLYGFGHTTPDNFVHAYDQLLVGGCLENDAGKKMVFYRRKKKVNDMVDEAGNPLDPGLLAPFLSGVDPKVFASLYGIDHDKLVQGGNDILDQKGEVGQALFAAGAGISSLQHLIEQLEKEAADLFKPSGQNPWINQAIKKFKELQKQAREKSLSYRDWEQHKDALADAENKHAGLEKERDHVNSELHRLNRLHLAIPELASLKSWQEQKQNLGPVIPLTPDFEKQVDRVNQEMQEAEEQLQKNRACNRHWRILIKRNRRI
ncbi:MAG: AAA family ATPase [Desulfobacteraceae bacterium]|nr:AAA family ATPase [Desulfobacteraceae bacterium]